MSLLVPSLCDVSTTHLPLWTGGSVIAELETPLMLGFTITLWVSALILVVVYLIRTRTFVSQKFLQKIFMMESKAIQRAFSFFFYTLWVSRSRLHVPGNAEQGALSSCSSP